MAAIRTQEQVVAFGYKKQSSALTANVATDLWHPSKLNPDIAFPDLATENDAAEMGKGDEFARNTYDVSWSAGGSIRKYLSSPMAEWACKFILGSYTSSGGVSTIVPQDPVTAGIETPYFSFLQQFRPGGSAPLDQLIVGCAVNDVTISLNSGPGRQSSQIAVGFVGTGYFIQPSGITAPAILSEPLLTAASACITINGVDYVAGKGLTDLTINLRNNIDAASGFYIGSGDEIAGNVNSGAIRGRLEFMSRSYGFSMTTRFSNTSAEFATLRSLTKGAATINLGAATDTLGISMPACRFQSVQMADQNGIAVLKITGIAEFDSVSGHPIIITAQNSVLPNIG